MTSRASSNFARHVNETCRITVLYCNRGLWFPCRGVCAYNERLRWKRQCKRALKRVKCK